MGCLPQRKLDAFEKFKAFKFLFENRTNLKIKYLRWNQGGEFISNEFEEFCESCGIKRHYFSYKNYTIE